MEKKKEIKKGEKRERESKQSEEFDFKMRALGRRKLV